MHLWVNYLLPWMWINSLLPIVVVLVEEEMMMTTIGANGKVNGFYNFKKQQTTPKHRNTLVILLSTLEMGAQSLMSKMNIGFGWSRTRVILIMMTGQTFGSLMKPLLFQSTYLLATEHSGTFLLRVPTASSKGGHCLH